MDRVDVHLKTLSDLTTRVTKVEHHKDALLSLIAEGVTHRCHQVSELNILVATLIALLLSDAPTLNDTS
jgi:hypothetical protein